MQTSGPKISIIIPVYNIAPWLEPCLRSVKNQTFSSLEIIAVNDGSTDESLAVLEKFSRQDARLKIITQSNQGPALARQTGVRAAQGEGLLFVDGDDILAPDYCEKLFHLYQQTQAELVLASTTYLETGVLLPALASASGLPQLVNEENRRLLWENSLVVMPVWGKLIARSLVQRVNWHESSYSDDIFPSVQLLTLAKQIALCPQAVYYYRQRRENSKSKTAPHLFEGVFNDFLDARRFLERTGNYVAVAPSFEYIRRACLISFIEKHGLSKQDEELLIKHAKDLQVPKGIFRKRSYKFQARQFLFDMCLKLHLPYRKIANFIRYATGHF